MRILIAEDNVVYRETLELHCRALLEAREVTSVATGREALQLCRKTVFNLLLVSLDLPDVSGFTVAEAAGWYAQPVVTLTTRCDEYTVYRAEKLRVRGFIDKRLATSRDLQEALESFERGGVYYSPSFVQKKNERTVNSVSFDKILSNRELLITSLIAVPLNDREIATMLSLSPQTVEKHRFNVLRKLHLSSVAELMRFAHAHGIAPKFEQIVHEIARHELGSSVPEAEPCTRIPM